MRACEACQTATSEGELALSPAGQWLCRRCHATCESRAATRQARSAEVARRCTCGNVVLPMRDVDEVDEDGKELLVQSSLYVCGRCGKEYRTQHPWILTVMVVALAAVIAAVRRAEGLELRAFTLLAALSLGAYVGRDIFNWFRHPRVH